MNLKKLFQHNKNRERELAVVARKTEEAQKARAEGTLVMSDDTLKHHREVNAGFKAIAMSQAGLTSQEVTQENVSQACKAMSTQIHLNGNGESLNQVQIHLPTEIRKVLQGRTSQEAFDFYWSLETFRKVWKELGFDEEDLRAFINQQVKNLGRTDLLEGSK